MRLLYKYICQIVPVGFIYLLHLVLLGLYFIYLHDYYNRQKLRISVFYKIGAGRPLRSQLTDVADKNIFSLLSGSYYHLEFGVARVISEDPTNKQLVCLVSG